MLTLEHVGQPRGELDILQAARDLPFGIGEHLAVLAREDGGELALALGQDFADPKEHIGALGQARGPPGGQRGLGGRDRFLNPGARGEHHLLFLLPGGGVEDGAEPSTSLMIMEQSLPASPASMSRWYSCCTCLPISRGVPVSSAALMASPMSLFASSVVKVGAKSLFEAAVETTPGTGYQVRSAHESPEETD